MLRMRAALALLFHFTKTEALGVLWAASTAPVFRGRLKGLALWGTVSGVGGGDLIEKQINGLVWGGGGNLPSENSRRPSGPTHGGGGGALALSLPAVGPWTPTPLSRCGPPPVPASLRLPVVPQPLARATPRAEAPSLPSRCLVVGAGPTSTAALSVTTTSKGVAPAPHRRGGGKRFYRLASACALVVHLHTLRTLTPLEAPHWTTDPRRTTDPPTCVGLLVVFGRGRSAGVPKLAAFEAGCGGLCAPLRGLVLALGS